MKKYITLFVLCLILSSCGYLWGWRVEQEVRDSCCNEKTQFVTYVWHNQKIVQAWYDDFDKVNAKLIQRRSDQADSLIFTLKKMR
jgi:hypothetical protein